MQRCENFDYFQQTNSNFNTFRVMKSGLFLIVFCCLAIKGFSQINPNDKEYVQIKGMVLSEAVSGEQPKPVVDAQIILKIADSLKLMTLSDSNGKYNFYLKKY